ncbi:MAG: Dabb family protein [Acidobacteria bacterium]|nr:Dabb family protein [Acidobacteriota bacterium]
MPVRTLSDLCFTYISFLTCGLIFSFSSLVLQGARDDLSSKLPAGEGKEHVMTLCTSCHGLESVVSQRKSPEDWEATVGSMRSRISAGMEQEAEIISRYLVANFSETSIPTPKIEAQRAASAGVNRIRIYHQVLFNFKPEISEEKRKAALESGRAALGSIPQVMNLVVGKIIQKDTGFQYGLAAGFASQEDLELYRTDSEHKKWAEDVFDPLIAKSSILDIIVSE